MPTFKAYRTFETDGKVESRFVDLQTDDLDPGDVLIKGEYSTINFKDALSHNGSGKIMRRYPTVAGIDLAGSVEHSTDPRFKPGEPVIVHGYDFGVAHDGGYAEYARVAGDWVVRRPQAMTAAQAMALGTAGFTAALAVELMQHNGLAPDKGPVIVDGATGGVGSVAIDILDKLGYAVTALTGKAHEAPYLRSIGAREILSRQDLKLDKVRPLDKATWAGAIDNLGGNVLAWLLSTMQIGGTVASIGLAADAKLATTVMPFILRGVHLLGVDSANCPMPLRQRIWDRLAEEWRPAREQAAAHTIALADLPAAFPAYLDGTIKGRTIVKLAQ